MKLIDSIDDIERENFINSADGFQGRLDDAEDYLNDRISFLDDIENIELYRVVFLKNIESLNTLKLGKHWTPDLYSLDESFIEYLQHECSGETISGKPFILKATYNKSSINFKTTLFQNLINPDEDEIFIDNKLDYLYPIEYKEPDDQEFSMLSIDENPILNFLLNKTPPLDKWFNTYSISGEIREDIQLYIKNNPFPNFSNGCQTESGMWGMALKKIFRDSNIEVCDGMYYDDGHTWIEIDGHIFDPTSSQFKDYPEIDDMLYDTHESHEIEYTIELKTISFKELYHKGTLDIKNKNKHNLEGCNGLSVSNTYDTWSKICINTDGDNYTLTKENNKFLDFQKLTDDDYNAILEWGCDNNYLKESIIYKEFYYDDEMDSDMYVIFHSLEEALKECSPDNIIIEKGYIATEEFKKINGVKNKENIDLISVIYTEKETNFDGVFWNDKTDIFKLSAPRAIILQKKLTEWNIQMKKPNIDFYNDNIEKCINQYESLTFQDVHGDAVENEIKSDARVLDIGCGTGRDAYHLASTGRKVVAIDPSSEMISYAIKNNSHENIEYLKSELPTLNNVNGKFDFVLMSAVWMHLEPDVQKESLKLLKNMLKNNGKMMILLRNGDFSDGRESYPFISDDFDVLKEDLKLSSKMLSGTKEDLLNRRDVSWSKLLISKNEKIKQKNKMVK
jgi:SAM-dependent methyltransferase